jgi:antitoxin ParD1/3/4
MRTPEQFSVTLPLEMADAVKAKVESWLRDQVAPAYDAIEADPTRAVSIDAVRARIAKLHQPSASSSMAGRARFPL